jgi:1-deoxy-D-xylulose-5-phosphate synthase
VVVRRGRHATLALVCYGSVLTEALRAAEVLSGEKISVDVINARFAAPLDDKLVGLLEKGKSLVTVEDHYLSCGFGSAVLEAAAMKGYRGPGRIHVLGAPRRFIGHDARAAQLMQAGIHADEIVKTARRLLAEQRGKRKSG